MIPLIFDILSGGDFIDSASDRKQPSRSCLSCEDGMVSFVAMVAILFFLVLLGLVGNVGFTVNNKIHVQNAADSTAYSSGIFMARGMNAVTASNHLIGELTALSVIHHAIRGPEGDMTPSFKSTPIPSSERRSVGTWKTLLKLAQVFDTIASTIPPPPPRMPGSAYNLISRGPASDEGATIFRSKLRLMKVLTSAYRVHGTGAWMQNFIGMAAVFSANLGFPPNVPYALSEANQSYQIGQKLCSLSIKWAEKAEQEWKLLDMLSDLAKAISPTKTAMRAMIVALHVGTRMYATGLLMKDLHRDLLDDLDKVHEVESTTWFARKGALIAAVQGETLSLMPDLPLKTEPAANELPDFKKSQLVRATFPWVNYWRKDILGLLRGALSLSRAAHHYKDFTNQFTIDISKELKDTAPFVNLYIIEGLDLAQSDKGQEEWTKQSFSADRLRDRLFAHVGLAWRQSPPLVSSGFFKPENPDGFVCYSQGIVYNANPQTVGQTRANMQPRVAWDTLNWVNDVPEYRKTDGHASYWPTGGDPEPSFDEPRIYINWRTKLVPVSRINDAVSSVPEKFQKPLKRLPMGTGRREPTQFRTH